MAKIKYPSDLEFLVQRFYLIPRIDLENGGGTLWFRVSVTEMCKEEQIKGYHLFEICTPERAKTPTEAEVKDILTHFFEEEVSSNDRDTQIDNKNSIVKLKIRTSEFKLTLLK